MVVHPSAGHENHTIVNAVMYHCKDNLSTINGVLRPGIVHRIDKDTTGVIVICKMIMPTMIWPPNLRNIPSHANIMRLYIIISRRMKGVWMPPSDDLRQIEKKWPVISKVAVGQ